jgi:pSer/pThr/pTyr-binding forkhead associated (FHA) protein
MVLRKWMQMFGTLIPAGGGDPIPLRKPVLIVGRRPSCDIQLDFPNVSSKHCEMAFVNGYWRLRDLHSSNGVKVNGVRIDEKFVQPGDAIAFAKHKFEIEYTPDPNAAPIEETDPFAMSLLEKAGLEEARSRRPARKSRTESPQKKPPSEMDDDDRALEWMGED